MSSSLTSIPGDVLIEIFSFCSISEISSLASTCSLYRYLSLQHTDRLFLMQCMLRGKTEQHKWGEHRVIYPMGNGTMTTAMVGTGNCSFVDFRPEIGMAKAASWSLAKMGITFEKGTGRDSLGQYYIWYASFCKRWIATDLLAKRAYVIQPGVGDEQSVLHINGTPSKSLLLDVANGVYLFSTTEDVEKNDFAGSRRSATVASWKVHGSRLQMWLQTPCNSAGASPAVTSEVYQGYLLSFSSSSGTPTSLNLTDQSPPRTVSHAVHMLAVSDMIVQNPSDLVITNTASKAKWTIRILLGDLATVHKYECNVGHCSILPAARVLSTSAYFTIFDPLIGYVSFMKLSFGGSSESIKAVELNRIDTAVACLDAGNGDVLVFDSDGYMLFDLFTGKMLYRRDTSSIREDMMFVLGEWRSNVKNLPVAIDATTASIVIQDYQQFRSLRLAGVKRPDEDEDDDEQQ